MNTCLQSIRFLNIKFRGSELKIWQYNGQLAPVFKDKLTANLSEYTLSNSEIYCFSCDECAFGFENDKPSVFLSFRIYFSWFHDIQVRSQKAGINKYAINNERRDQAEYRLNDFLDDRLLYIDYYSTRIDWNRLRNVEKAVEIIVEQDKNINELQELTCENGVYDNEIEKCKIKIKELEAKQKRDKLILDSIRNSTPSIEVVKKFVNGKKEMHLQIKEQAIQQKESQEKQNKIKELEWKKLQLLKQAEEIEQSLKTLK